MHHSYYYYYTDFVPIYIPLALTTGTTSWLFSIKRNKKKKSILIKVSLPESERMHNFYCAFSWSSGAGMNCYVNGPS